MRRKQKRIILVLLVLFVAIQFYQPARNTDSGQVDKADFTEVYKAPVNVKNILQVSCYDCHSNNTRYEWFDYIQPIRMLVEYHINKAKEDLNFNEWGNYYDLKKGRLLESIKTQVEKKKMPLPSYTWLHPEVKLSDAQRATLINWIKGQE